MPPRKSQLVVLAFATSLAACRSVSPAAAQSSLDGTSWTLADLPGRPLPAGPTVTLQFGAARLSGSDGAIVVSLRRAANP